MGNDDGIHIVTCPECSEPVKMGLPRCARIEAVSPASHTDLEKPFPSGDVRHKPRPNRCDNGHEFRVRFAF